MAPVFSDVFTEIAALLLVAAVIGAMGYRKRTGFLAGLTVAQDQRILPDPGGVGPEPGPYRRRHHGPHHPGGVDYHQRLHLHDPLLPSPVRVDFPLVGHVPVSTGAP